MWHGFQIIRWHILVLGLSFFCGFVRGVFLRNSVESSAKYISSQFKNNGSAFGFTKWRSVSLVVRQLTSVVCLAPAKTRWGWTSFHSAAATGVGMTPHVNRLVQNSAETTARAFFFLINVFPFKGSVNASDEASNFDDYHAGIRGLLIH